MTAVTLLKRFDKLSVSSPLGKRSPMRSPASLRRHRLPALVVGGALALSCAAAPVLSAQAAGAGDAPAGLALGPANHAGWKAAQAFNPAPTSRTVRPTAVHSTHGTVAGADGLGAAGAPIELSGTGSYVVLDFGREVGGTVSLRFTGASDDQQHLGIAFSESSDYLDFSKLPLPSSDTSTGGPRSRDGAIDVPAAAGSTYTTPLELQRGGFRYLVLFSSTPGSISVDDVSAHITASPLMGDDLQDYPNYFYSSDDLLNRIWYAGAYTVQLDTIAPDQGRAWPAPDELWDNSGVVGAGRSILVDGAKRDRTVWSGDLPVELATALATTGDTESTRNALDALFGQQRDNGMFLYSGPELSLQHSDTYHLWTLIGADHYVAATGDTAWLRDHWAEYRKGIDYAWSKVDAAGLFYLDETYDSASQLTKGENLAANVLLWSSLDQGARLADLAGDTATAATYRSRATALRTQIYASFWDSAVGAFRNYPTSTVIPQDGNVFAVWLGMVTDPEQLRSIQAVRGAARGPLGTQRPEHKNQNDMLDASIEVHQQFLTGTKAGDANAVDLIRSLWGYQLDAPQGTGSTFWESMRDEGCICSSYVSLAHGWSTGPTSALTSYVLGLRSTGVGGTAWTWQPHLSGLRFAQGRLDLPTGTLTASWHTDADGLRAMVTAPRATDGTIAVPADDDADVRVGGKLVWSGGQAAAAGVHRDGEYVVVPLDRQPGNGSRTIPVAVG